MQNKNISTFTYAFIFCFIVISIIIYPSEAYNAAQEGLKLWFNVVCPALLPFFICIDILIGLGVVSFLGSMFRGVMVPVFNVPGEASFAFFMSIASGYPIGAKITSRLRLDNICSRSEGQRMLSLCSTSGPLFIIGAVATGILGNPALGFLLASAHYLSAVVIGFFMKYYDIKNRAIYKKSAANPFKVMLEHKKKDNRAIGAVMGDAVVSGINTILVIGGFIILFSVITCILKISGILAAASKLIGLIIPFLDQQTISSLLVGVLEVTNGIKECAALSLPLITKASIVSFLIGFGGLSVNAQVLSIISATDLKFSIYIFLKAAQGILASVFCFVTFGLFNHLQVINVYEVYEKSNFVPYNSYNWLNTLLNSTENMLMILALILVSGIILDWNTP